MSDIYWDDARRLRIGGADLLDNLTRHDRDPSFATPCLVAQTKVQSSYPSVAQNFFACAPLTILGLEVEGGTGVIMPGSATFLALNLGSAVPPAGTNIVATFVDSRWVFRFDG